MSNQPSCATALFGLNLDRIKTYCNYHIVFGDLPKEIFHINANKLLLNNVTSLTVYRKQCASALKINNRTIVVERLLTHRT